MQPIGLSDQSITFTSPPAPILQEIHRRAGEREAMHILIAAVGKVREPYLTHGIDEYRKRLGRYATVSIAEVAEEPAPETLSPAEQAQVKAREGERLAPGCCATASTSSRWP